MYYIFTHRNGFRLCTFVKMWHLHQLHVITICLIVKKGYKNKVSVASGDGIVITSRSHFKHDTDIPQLIQFW